MNDEARQVLLQQFCEPHRLDPARLSPGLGDMIAATSAPYLLLVECLDHLEQSDPTNGLVLKLVDRAYQSIVGVFALIALGHVREAEILVRSVYESAATTAYIIQEQPPTRMSQFFLSYINGEREQNRKWGNDLSSMQDESREDHESRIAAKNEAMDRYEQFVRGYMEHCEVPLEQTSRWPPLIERLEAMGRRVEYRTVYAAMCSQSHHDAEDVLNFFFANSLVGADHIAERMEREADTFSIFMVLFGLHWFVEAMQAAGTMFNFPTVTMEAQESLARIAKELQFVAPHLDKGEFPTTWVMPD